MRRPFSMLAAAVIAITGAVASFAPAQAAIRAAPAVLDQSAPAAGIVQVHRERYRHRHRDRHYSYHRPYHRHHVRRRYVHPYPYAYYPRPYYHRRPGVSIQFSFGGGHRW